ncbi:MAG: flagellar hook-associated protein FlgL [Peptococcaceae bacterium]|nr:flagellar hook-associated protein FlgL [Peptococcaceae bacterium]
MRVTNRYIANSLNKHIQQNLSRLARTQEQLSTSKTMLRPSDRPDQVSQLLSLKSGISYLEQYNRNLDDGLSYLYLEDSVMQTLGDILNQAGEMAVQGSNSTYAQEDMAALGEQIDKMIDHVVDLANSSVGGRFIFAGTKDDKAPFQRVGDTIIYTGDLNGVYREVLTGDQYRIDSPGITTTTPVGVFGHGEETFPGSGVYVVYDPLVPSPEEGIFDCLFKLRDRLNAGDHNGVDSSIGEVQQRMNQILQRRVGVGARTRHFEALKDQLMDQEIKLKDHEQKLEGADMYKLSINMSQEQVVYQASLASGASIMQISLLNFLK